MKRFIVTILCALYSIASMGITVHAHYCMGHIVSVGLEADSHETCTNCGMKKKERKGCCSDEHRTLKAADHSLLQQAYKATIVPATTPALPIRAVYSIYDAGLLSEPRLISRSYHSLPAQLRSCPWFIYIRNLRV